MLYFAYGSNLDPQQMKERCPSSRFECIAFLPGRRLAFTRYSRRRGGGVADAVEDEAGPGVWGVVYDISEEDLMKLDQCEGYYGVGEDNAYDRELVSVLANGDEARGLEAFSYFVAKRSGEEHPPSAGYMRQIISGAERWGLPEEYIDFLKGIELAQGNIDL